MYRALGASAFEFLWVAGRGRAASLHASLDGPSRARLEAALAADRGIVLAASHTGNWDLAACAMARLLASGLGGTGAREFLVVTKHLSVRRLDEFWQATRAAQGVHLAPARGSMARARDVLSNGGAVATMIDQVPARRRHALRGEVLGRPAWIDRAPAALAARSGAPLVVAASRRDPSGEHRLEVLGVHEPPARAGRRWVDRATACASRELDGFIRAHPTQWLWLHRRWRDPLEVRPSTEEPMTLNSPSPCPAPLTTRSSSPATHSAVASSSAPASTRTSTRLSAPSTHRAPRS
jgi:KDO2-lipid IV(A) lauroyltransferase